MGKMKIAVTGSSGFIGKALTKKILAEGWDVLEMDLSEGINLSDQEQLQHVPSFDTLIHLAAKSFVPTSYKEPYDFYSNNYLATLNVLELCRKYQAKIIFTSSYVYGHPQYLPIDENHPVQSFNPYSDTKLISENLCRSYHNFFEIKTLIVRPFNAYGPNQNENFLIPSILKQVGQGEIILHDPRPKRDFVYLDDLVEFFIKAIEYKDSAFEIFNVGSGINYSVKQIVDIILRNIDRELKVQFSQSMRTNEIIETLANISKAQTVLNWVPKTSFEAGIREIMTDMKIMS